MERQRSFMTWVNKMVSESDFNELANTVLVLRGQIADLNKQVKGLKQRETSAGNY